MKPEAASTRPSPTPTRALEQPTKRETQLEPDLRQELARAETYLGEGGSLRPAASLRQAAVIQACRLPPTRTNRKALEHAFEWLKPLQKPERIERAPSLATVRRELQLFYLERSREYHWARLDWEEVVLTGVLLDPEDLFEQEVIGGVDMIPYALGIHDPQRGRWLVLDLSTGDSYSKELMTDVLRDLPPTVLKKAGSTALRGGLP
jgi:hypothetical protein